MARKLFRRRRPRRRFRRKRRSRGYELINARLTRVVSLSTTIGGIHNSIYDLGKPNVSVNSSDAYDDWSTYAALYDQYRCRAFKMEFIPAKPNDVSTATAYRPFFMYYDRDSDAPITSMGQIATVCGRRVKNLDVPWKYYIRLSKGSSTAPLMGGWKDCAVPLGTGSVKTYADGLNVSTSYGIIVLTMYCQFKNRV